MDALKFKPFTEQILKAIVPLLKNTISLIKEVVVSALSSFFFIKLYNK